MLNRLYIVVGVIAILALIGVYILIWHTKFGYAMRVLGANSASVAKSWTPKRLPMPDSYGLRGCAPGTDPHASQLAAHNLTSLRVPIGRSHQRGLRADRSFSLSHAACVLS